LAGGAGGFGLDATEIGFLNNGTPALLQIGRANGTGAVTGNAFTFDSPLTLAGGDMTLATITKATGKLDLFSTGDIISAALNLSAGTGILTLSADSATITGTINGIAGVAAAAQALVIPPHGAGPFLANGEPIPIQGQPPPPIPAGLLTIIASQTQPVVVVSVVTLTGSIADATLTGGPGGGGGGGGGSSGGAPVVIMRGLVFNPPPTTSAGLSNRPPNSLNFPGMGRPF
jgi:hypothetical protein